ncbi:hypothetical protein [Streptomyces physcomitrii]|uniref:Uncharacterized protein n=1 Tax=Streptomyces physcomitrii TaxID=2724184 RepID=A0ABX1HB34_9ACTN|nr:hypothetical protein [Streptomyces physcomitrii]NKI45545.1 hypothetical protein [Streptomyces physcomitrii]
MVGRNGRRENLRRVAERRRRPDEPPTRLTPARNWLVAAVLAGLSAVIATTITGAGAFVEENIKSIFREEGHQGTSPAEVKTAVTPLEGGGLLVSAGRVTSTGEKKVLEDPYAMEPESFMKLHKRLRSTQVGGNFYKLVITNTSASAIKIVNVSPVVSRRSAPLSETLIEPLGGANPGEVFVDLDLNVRHPSFTRRGKPYFTSESRNVAAGKSFEIFVDANVEDYYVEYHLKVDYVDSLGRANSLEVHDPSEGVGIFRLSGILPPYKYTDYWGVEDDLEKPGLKLLTAEEKREKSR